MRVPWWGVASSALAPVFLIGGWTAAADLQPLPFDPVSRSISSLASAGMPYSWVIMIGLLGVGGCHAITGLALRPAARAGRILLIIGGICGMLVAANPQPQHGSSPAHQLFASAGIVLLTFWPVFSISRDPSAALGLRPVVCYAAAGVTLGLLAWFCAELVTGNELGLAERVLTAGQALWPFVVVLSIVAARHGAWPAWQAAETDAARRIDQKATQRPRLPSRAG